MIYVDNFQYLIIGIHIFQMWAFTSKNICSIRKSYLYFLVHLSLCNLSQIIDFKLWYNLKWQ